MEFKAKKLNLDLELTILNGEVVSLKPKIEINGVTCIKLAKEWKALEENNKGDSAITGLEVAGIQLSTIYPKSKDWFIEKLDPQTIREILMFVARTVGGIQKN